MSGKNKGKAKIQMSKPDLPPFLQRMKEQIVANEDADRREQSEKKRKQREASGANARRGGDDDDDDPTIVKVNEEDLTEEEYKRMKLDLETQYKLDEDRGRKSKPEELNIDDLIGVRQKSRPAESSSGVGSNKSTAATTTTTTTTTTTKPNQDNKSKKGPTKKLSYETSSESESE